ncbi:hypothetical protein D3C81_203880 [compost metagenome]
MKKYLIVISCLSISAYSIAKERPELEYQFPNCGISLLNGKTINKVCATRDFIAPEPRKRKRDWLAFLAAEGSSGYKGPRDPVGGILHFENKELDMQGYVWDFSKQENPSLVLEGHDSVIKKGVILNAYLSLGSNEYLPPNFSDERKITNQSNLYAKITGSNNRIENFTISNLKTQSRGVTLNSWGGGVDSSVLILKNNINIQGSKTNIKNNILISEAKIAQDRSVFSLNKINKAISLDSSQQIFPDRSYDRTAIPSALYVKFSPDTVIDGNTFTLTQRNDQAYAIVLDHSPRVRITNNTFNGFKVPILMDQWSSIVDEKGKEIKLEQFTGYGNIINPNEFAGHVTMNRKGEIVKE